MISQCIDDRWNQWWLENERRQKSIDLFLNFGVIIRTAAVFVYTRRINHNFRHFDQIFFFFMVLIIINIEFNRGFLFRWWCIRVLCIFSLFFYTSKMGFIAIISFWTVFFLFPVKINIYFLVSNMEENILALTIVFNK